MSCNTTYLSGIRIQVVYSLVLVKLILLIQKGFYTAKLWWPVSVSIILVVHWQNHNLKILYNTCVLRVWLSVEWLLVEVSEYFCRVVFCRVAFCFYRINDYKEDYYIDLLQWVTNIMDNLIYKHCSKKY